MGNDTGTPARVRWARLRFSIIGPLLSAPAEAGDLAPRIAELASRLWRHPTTDESIRFSAKSIERWYYAARNEADPIRALERKVPKQADLEAAGNPSLMTTELKATLADHAAGNYRVLMNLGDELLVLAADRDLPRLDEKLFIDAFNQQPRPAKVAPKRR